MPLPVSILRERGRVELPALPAERGLVFGRAIQHCELRAAHADGGAGVRFEARGICAYVRGSAPLLEPRGAGEAAAFARTASAAADEIEPGGAQHP